VLCFKFIFPREVSIPIVFCTPVTCSGNNKKCIFNKQIIYITKQTYDYLPLKEDMHKTVAHDYRFARMSVLQ
jgi:hypothetical protein